MLKNKIFALFLGILLIPAVSANAQERQFINHTVVKGQGLYSIARMYGVTEEEIINANPGSDTVIKAGEILSIPVHPRTENEGKFHTAEAGETLYSLAKANGITVADLCNANPGLDISNFKAGQTIIIPQAKATAEDRNPEEQKAVSAEQANPQENTQETGTAYALHTVAHKETIFRICKNYGISQAEFLNANPQYRYIKLQVGSQVKIPIKSSENDKPSVAESTDRTQPSVEKTEPEQQPYNYPTPEIVQVPDVRESDPNTINAVLLLPFELNGPKSQEQRKLVEFYQGMLLALNELKQSGISVNLSVYDTGSARKSIKDILEKESLRNADIIFGPKYDSHINDVAAFAKENKIPLVLPLNSKVDAVYTNPYIYQLNTPQSYLMSDVSSHFLKQFYNPRVIVLKPRGEEDTPMVAQILQDLESKGIHHITVTPNIEDENSAAQIVDMLDPINQNVFIINSNNSSDLASLLPLLQLITRTKSPSVRTCLFGYPEYQIYAPDHMEKFFEVDTWFYSWFYTNTQLPEAISFESNFRKAYSSQMMQSYPNFAEYGYDMTLYFLYGIARYHEKLAENINQINTIPVQMGFKFERASNWGGFINRKVFFIHLSDQYNIEKKDFDR